MSNQAQLEQVSRELTDKGLLVEAGFVGLRMAAISPGASQSQVAEMRMAFFAGAQHLFASMLSIMDPGSEPTEKDLARMDAINKELREFVREFSLRQSPTKGNA